MRFFLWALLAGIFFACAPGAQAASVASSLSWLKSRIAATGLIDSFVEDQVDYSYTYDNALAALAFISAGEFAAAQKILDAFLAITPDPSGGFVHRYHTADRRADGILFTGSNAYLLQAMNLYYKETSDARYNNLARRIGDFLLTRQDADGGLFGRLGYTWKSAENNLGALSALHNLGKVQGIPNYVDRAALIRNFLITECWDGIRFLQGESDPGIVTDVQALGILVLGATYKNGAYWIEGQTLNTKRYSGRKTVTGFDMAPDKDTVWTEGTLQESLAFAVASDLPRSNSYRIEAEKLSRPNGSFQQASNSGTALPPDSFQAWRAAAPTAWYIYSANQDNVLELLP